MNKLGKKYIKKHRKVLTPGHKKPKTEHDMSFLEQFFWDKKNFGIEMHFKKGHKIHTRSV